MAEGRLLCENWGQDGPVLLPPLPHAEGPTEHGTLTSGRLCTLSSDVCPPAQYCLVFFFFQLKEKLAFLKREYSKTLARLQVSRSYSPMWWWCSTNCIQTILHNEALKNFFPP